MTTRKRLPPGARWVPLPNGERRVELVMDVGIDPATGKRRQTRRRLRTVEDAINTYAEIRSQAVAYGSLGLRQLTKAHVVELAIKLAAGGMPRADGKRRKPWTARTIKLLLFTLGQVLDDAVKQGLLARNVVALVDRPPGNAERCSRSRTAR